MKNHQPTKTKHNDRFDLRALGLDETTLRTVAGAQPVKPSTSITQYVVTPCCW